MRADEDKSQHRAAEVCGRYSARKFTLALTFPSTATTTTQTVTFNFHFVDTCLVERYYYFRRQILLSKDGRFSRGTTHSTSFPSPGVSSDTQVGVSCLLRGPPALARKLACLSYSSPTLYGLRMSWLR